MSIAKITIVSEGFRGLWLAQELVKNKFSVTWLSLDSEVKNYNQLYMWQMCSEKSFLELNNSQQEYLKSHFKFKKQNDFQVLTKNGLLDLNKQGLGKFLEYYYKNAHTFMMGLLKAHHKNEVSLREAYLSKVYNFPRGQRWLLEIINDLRQDELLDLYSPQYLLDEEFDEYLKSALVSAEKAGVQILKNTSLNDIGKDGARITGIEVNHANAFRPCDQLVVCVDENKVKSKLPWVEAAPSSEKIWLHLSFKLKPQSRPWGVDEFFSYAFDPMMPLNADNFALLRWKENANHDQLCVWVIVEQEETKKQSFYGQMQDLVKNKLCQMITSFEDNYEETIKSAQIYKSFDLKVGQPELIKKNTWLCSPKTDYGYEFITMFKSEEKILAGILKHYSKEIQRDRKIHASPHGKALDA